MSGEVARLVESALAVSAETFARGLYEAAYLDLTTAMNLARGLGEPVILRRVAEVAREQGREIDVRSPQHRLSSMTAKAKGRESGYELAARTAESAARIAEKRRGEPETV